MVKLIEKIKAYKSNNKEEIRKNFTVPIIVAIVSLVIFLFIFIPTAVDKEEVLVYDANLTEVTITLPAYLFEGEEEFDPQSLKEEYGYIAVVVNEDKSISITMTKAKHIEVMESLKSDLLDEFDALIEGVDTPFIKSIETNDDFTNIIVAVDEQAHNSLFFDFIPDVLAHAATIYQQYNGDEPEYTITIKNATTEEILSSIIYPDPEAQTEDKKADEEQTNEDENVADSE
jgi:hypothetical protein